VAERRAKARKKMASLRKKGVDIQPIEIEGRKIARKFWGEAWCDHLESFSDYDNRLPRGRTYVRNGSVCHLAIKKGEVEAKVSGSDIYEVRVKIDTLSATRWNAIKEQCSGQIGALLELLQGKLSDNIMSVVTDRQTGLFPKPAEIKFGCNCPDYARMCKHIAAVLYGIGARLDDDPTLLFRLRGVNHEELIDTQVAHPAGTGKGKSKRLSADSLGDVFGIDLDLTTDSSPQQKGDVSSDKGAAKAKNSKKKVTVKKAAVKKVTVKNVTVKKAAVKNVAVKKVTVKKVTVKKAAVKKAAVKKAAVKKAAVKKAAVKKAAVKKVKVKKVKVKKVAAKKVTARTKTNRRSKSKAAGF
jgi:uncharacterized Zn finger protein